MYDIIIIGAGPAGLTAATYSLRAGKSVLIAEKAGFGGQVAFSPKIENFPGTASIAGTELAEKLVEQALELGAETAFGDVDGIKGSIGDFTVTIDGEEHRCKAVIIATGAKHRRLNVSGEDEYAGNGVSYCAVCDGAFFAGQSVCIVGGGNSALQEAILLSDICTKVTVIQNLAFLTGEEKLCEAVKSRDNIDIIYSSTVDSVYGGEALEGIVIRDADTQETKKIPCDGVFVAIGLEPQNKAFENAVNLNEFGYIIADESCLTSTPGIFAAGDCRTKSVRQITTAVGDGAVASVNACKAINQLRLLTKS